MNYIWGIIIILSVLWAFIVGNAASAADSLIESAENAVEFTLKLTGMFCLWGGITNIAEKAGITDFISKLLSPALKRLFPQTRVDEHLGNRISLSITANLLGVGNAATPLGIRAMQGFKKNPLMPETATNEMVTFVVMNTAAMRLIPTTSAQIRSAYNAASPFDILPATLLASACSLFVGITLSKISGKKHE